MRLRPSFVGLCVPGKAVRADVGERVGRGFVSPEEGEGAFRRLAEELEIERPRGVFAGEEVE